MAWHRFKSAIFWMLLLAVPLQGIAASSMLLCGAAHHGAISTQPAQAPTHTQQRPVSVMDSYQHSLHASETAPAHDHTASDTLHAQEGKVHTGIDKCSVCAACCHATAMTQTAVAPPASNLAQASPAAAGIVSFVGIVPGGLERPPKQLLG